MKMHGPGNIKFKKTYRKYLNNVTGKARQKGTTESSHTGHCARTSKGDNVKIQNVGREK
jgi:hypothetical protein